MILYLSYQTQVKLLIGELHTQQDTWYTGQAPWDNDQRVAELHIHNLSSA
jgi:hypothetical protein